MTDLVIRPPQSGDGEDLARIWLESAIYYANLNPELFQVPNPDGLAEWSETWALSTTSEYALLLVAEQGGRVVGFVDAAVHQPLKNAAQQFVRDVALARLFVNALIVHPSYWRAGVGTRLMKAAEEWGRSKGAVIALLDTYIDSPVSVPFYEKRMGYSRRAIHFRKRLT